MSPIALEEQLRPVTEVAVKFNCKVRFYPDNQFKVTCFSRPVYNPFHAEEYKKDERKEKRRKEKRAEEMELMEFDLETGKMAYKYVEGKTILNPFIGEIMPFTELKLKDNELRRDNIKRAIDRAFEIGIANSFQYFITLTLDRTKIDRYDKKIIYSKLKIWLDHRVQRNQMDYILFPEYHKQEADQTERAVHFHLLANAEGFELVDSGKKTKSGQTIYNLPGWKYGFSTVIKLDGQTAIVRYVTKYITKGNARIFGKLYLSGGKTLKREVPADFMNIDYDKFDGQEYYIPAANLSVKYKTINLGISEGMGDEDEDTYLEQANQ